MVDIEPGPHWLIGRPLSRIGSPYLVFHVFSSLGLPSPSKVWRAGLQVIQWSQRRLQQPIAREKSSTILRSSIIGQKRLFKRRKRRKFYADEGYTIQTVEFLYKFSDVMATSMQLNQFRSNNVCSHEGFTDRSESSIWTFIVSVGPIGFQLSIIGRAARQTLEGLGKSKEEDTSPNKGSLNNG